MIILVSIISIILLGLYALEMKKTKLTTKVMITISVMVAIAYVLYMIKFISYPQGGGITLFSTLPIMMVALIYGRGPGLTAGLIFGVLKLLNGGVIMHPIQFILDYMLAQMALGLAGSFGNDKKSKIILGCLFAGIMGTIVSTISGYVFFGMYAPPGMNPLLYSIVYNFSSAGVESVLTAILMGLIPMEKFIKVAKLGHN
jgi:thiamine transporter